MNKGLKALYNIRRESGTPYFSSLYDIDKWHEDFFTLEKELLYGEIYLISLQLISDIIRDFNKGEFANAEYALKEISIQLQDVLYER